MVTLDLRESLAKPDLQVRKEQLAKLVPLARRV